jgi:hypothetical protein
MLADSAYILQIRGVSTLHMVYLHNVNMSVQNVQVLERGSEFN